MEIKTQEEWRDRCKKEVMCQILLNRLKKKGIVKGKVEKKIQGMIDKFGSYNFQFFNRLRAGEVA